MANQGAKKRLEENRQKLKWLKYALLSGLASFIIVRLVLLSRTITNWHYAGLVATAAVGWFTYSGISSFAEPVYDEKGELIDGGADLSMRGMCGYYHDVLYITIFVLILGSFTNWAWLAYLLVPGYAIYKLFEKVIIPYFQSSTSDGQVMLTDAQRKKLEKTEKRAERRRHKWQ